jgi:hypothetical protein
MSAIFINSQASIMDFQATEEASNPRRKHPALQNMKFLNYFLFLCVIFGFWTLVQVKVTSGAGALNTNR